MICAVYFGDADYLYLVNMSISTKRMGKACTALGRALRSFIDHRNPRDAAAISYFSFFALFPALFILIAVAKDILDRFGLGGGKIVEKVAVLFPVSSNFLNESLGQIMDPSPALLLSCIVVVMWTSSWVFSIVENALNRAWDVPKRRTFWESRIRSITVVVLGGTILLASVAILAAASPASDETKERLRIYVQDPIISWLWQIVLYCAVLFLAILVFGCVYKLMPDKKVCFTEALSGAVIAALLWEIGTYIFINLVPNFDYERIYGRMGAVIALLAWVYTSNLLMLFGANFSAQLHRLESGSVPAAAEKTVNLESAKEGNRKLRSFPRYR